MDEFRPTDTNIILGRLNDIEKNISMIREYITKYPEISFYKIAKNVFDRCKNNDIYKESLYIVVTLEKIIELMKKVEETRNLF